MTLEEALHVADDCVIGERWVMQARIVEALGMLADEVRRKDVDADIGRQLQPLAKRTAVEWRDYNDDMALSFIEALDALADFFGEDGQ